MYENEYLFPIQPFSIASPLPNRIAMVYTTHRTYMIAINFFFTKYFDNIRMFAFCTEVAQYLSIHIDKVWNIENSTEQYTCDDVIEHKYGRFNPNVSDTTFVNKTTTKNMVAKSPILKHNDKKWNWLFAGPGILSRLSYRQHL